MRPWMALVAWTSATSLVLPKQPGFTPTPCSLPGTVSRESYLDVPDHVFQTLMRCPVGLDGCSGKLVSCIPSTHVTTCSCPLNCKTYSDCCWNVEHDRETLEAPGISCVRMTTEETGHYPVYMVSSCRNAWPDDDVRAACEGTQFLGDHFNLIPVTSNSGEVTYRNGFCALCNDDIINTTFWKFALDEELGQYFVVPPKLTLRRPAHYLRPCVDDSLVDTCSLEVPETVSRKCKAYYAPVISDPAGGPTFKNLYCALCNGIHPSNLSCSPTRNLDVVEEKPVVPLTHKSLASLFRPVTRTPSCHAMYNGRCYIQRAPDYREKDPEMNSTKSQPQTALPTSERSPSSSGGGEAQQYVTLICVSLSIFFLALKLVVFCAYRESRSFASKCTLCLSVTLIITHVLYMITASLGVPTLACAIGAALVHYGFLSTFCWTCALSFDICSSLTNLTLSSNRESVPVTYSAFSCGLPLIIVASAVTVDLVLPGSALSPRYGRLVCWIGSFWGLVVYFLVPVAILLLCCFAFYLRVVLYVSETSLAHKTVNGIRDRQRAHAVLFVRLALVMGSPWAVSFLATVVESVVLDCVVDVLVGLEGVYLFVAFKDYRYFLSSIRKRVGDTYSSDVSRSPHINERSSAKRMGA
ncbi:hypothetical protein HPB52_008674 [Rhipicephalus sanguineus]|uniref:G-protein coupled receptors family 2 profile 2 domain-containing protein n=2 Tax=Rhipicephalus sanguineus TaxID=34632 RepID=A0A9D4QCZ0_RHISA|nr:hypothetical protein HPB52_008674 [Rhipicephalus sanguineus]